MMRPDVGNYEVCHSFISARWLHCCRGLGRLVLVLCPLVLLRSEYRQENHFLASSRLLIDIAPQARTGMYVCMFDVVPYSFVL